MNINTKDYMLAPSGKGPWAYTWSDKPHRLVYDLCGEVDRLRTQQDKLLAVARYLRALCIDESGPGITQADEVITEMEAK